MRSRTKVKPLDLLARLDGRATSGDADALLALMGSTGNAIRGAFRAMEIAEEEIAARWPKLSRRQTSFAFEHAFSGPTAPIKWCSSDIMVRAHLREMYARIPDDCVVHPLSGAIWTHLGQLTRAEILGLLCEASLRHPLSYYDTFMYEMLFRELFPGVSTGRDETVEPFPNVGPTLERARRDAQEWLAKESPERAPRVRELREQRRAEARP